MYLYCSKVETIYVQGWQVWSLYGNYLGIYSQSRNTFLHNILGRIGRNYPNNFQL